MTHVSVIRVLTLALVLAHPAISAPHAFNPAQVAVFLQFDHEVPAVAMTEMKSEVSTILRPTGYEFVWLAANSEAEMRDYPDLVFVHFSGNCGAAVNAPHGELPRVATGVALAKTSVSDGQVLPFTEVRCDELRSFLAAQMSGRAPNVRLATIGRAMGRVLAHEMFHMLAATRDHAQAGVARASYPASELASDKAFQFQPEEIRVLQQSRRRVPDEFAVELRH